MLGISLMVVGTIWWLLIEKAQVGQIVVREAIISVLYLSIVTSFLCQTIQIYAQKYTKAVLAGIILMLEGLFAMIFSILLGYDELTYDLLIGGAIMMVAFILAVINFDHRKKRNGREEVIKT
jgi:drug/metabolite transporter (DMT)-like permease